MCFGGGGHNEDISVILLNILGMIEFYELKVSHSQSHARNTLFGLPSRGQQKVKDN